MDDRKMSQAGRPGGDAGELLPTLAETRVVLEDFRLEYNHRRPHSSLGYQAPAAFAAGLESVVVSTPGSGPPGRDDAPGAEHSAALRARHQERAGAGILS